MKRSSTTGCVENTNSTQIDSSQATNLLSPNQNNLAKSFNNLSLCYSTITLNEEDDAKLLNNDDETIKKELDTVSVVIEQQECTKNENPKLVSPYGDWCAFTGGSGSGGCIFTGPYEPMIIPKDDFSDESFESTEESDANIDFIGPIGITHNNFQNTEVVWAKRPGLPWFPGIIINPNSINKEIKDLMKHIGASAPHKDQLADYSLAVINSRETDKLFFVFLFNRKKTWLWLPESKLRPFCKENDKLFLENSPLLTNKYKKELEKAYKKAKRFSKGSGPIISASNSPSHEKSKHDNNKH